jgi:hypothetical protein
MWEFWEKLKEDLNQYAVFKLSLCSTCRNIDHIDVYGDIKCSIGISGKPKIYCRHYVKREEK